MRKMYSLATLSRFVCCTASGFAMPVNVCAIHQSRQVVQQPQTRHVLPIKPSHFSERKKRTSRGADRSDIASVA